MAALRFSLSLRFISFRGVGSGAAAAAVEPGQEPPPRAGSTRRVFGIWPGCFQEEVEVVVATPAVEVAPEVWRIIFRRSTSPPPHPAVRLQLERVHRRFCPPFPPGEYVLYSGKTRQRASGAAQLPTTGPGRRPPPSSVAGWLGGPLLPDPKACLTSLNLTPGLPRLPKALPQFSPALTTTLEQFSFPTTITSTTARLSKSLVCLLYSPALALSVVPITLLQPYLPFQQPCPNRIVLRAVLPQPCLPCPKP